MGSSRARPRVVVTGASGFLGRRLVASLRTDHDVVAIDRRPQAAAGLDDHPNQRWLAIDLADAAAVQTAFDGLRAEGGADAVVHLAAYYDFTGEEHPEYRRSNVDALRVLLESCRGMGLRRFVFASSVAACPFSTPGAPITEATPPHGAHVYARTKRAGEELLREYAGEVPSCSIRFAALFSDWCEYHPLYVFLETWLSRRWNARILGGRGRSAIPFLHVRDALAFVRRVLERRDALDDGEVLLASPDGAVSHAELFEAATAYAHGAPRRPLRVPRVLARPGMRLRDALGRAFGERPFERPWMADYIDRRMDVDARRTRARLGWAPVPRREILRRIPFLVENRKADPIAWSKRNREALDHLRFDPRYRVQGMLEEYEAEIVRAFAERVAGPEGRESLRRYRALPLEEREWTWRLVLRGLVEAARTGQKTPFMGYCQELARRRLGQGFSAEEVVHALRTLDRACVETLRRDPRGGDLADAIHDHVHVTLEFGIDRVLEVFDDHASGGSGRPG